MFLGELPFRQAPAPGEGGGACHRSRFLRRWLPPAAPPWPPHGSPAACTRCHPPPPTVVECRQFMTEVQANFTSYTGLPRFVYLYGT